MRTTCVGGSVLLSFTFAKSQSRPTPTASHPRHPSRSSSTLFASPFYQPGLAHRHSFLSLSFFLSLYLYFTPFPSIYLSIYLFFSFFSSLDRKRVCASIRFITTATRPAVSLLSTNNNARDNFFHSLGLPRSQTVSLECPFRER